MKTFGLALLSAIAGYIAGFLAGLGAVEAFSSNSHDRSMEAAMTGAFVVGPLMAVLSVVVILIVRARRSQDKKDITP